MEPLPNSRNGRSRALAWIGIAAPFLAGAVLRLWKVWDQILGGDEVHAIRAMQDFSLPKILVTYQQTDNCIPLTAFYKLVAMGGGPLTEMTFRLPALFCGLAALLVLPAAFEGKVSRGTVLAYRWLVAISPLLVLYSRIARSYLPMVLLSFGAVMSFEAWWRTRSGKPAAAYVGLGALAVWFHLGAGPIVAAPFLFAAGDALFRRDFRRDLRGLIVLGLSLTAAFALFLAPAGRSLAALISTKHAEQTVPWRQVIPALLRLGAGTASGWLAAAFWIATLAGLVLLWRNQRRLALYMMTIVAGHVAGLLILSPVGLASPVIFGRYLLPVVPFVLFWAAVAMGTRIAAGGIVVAALALGGPFGEWRYWRSSFLGHNDLVGFHAPLRALPAAEIPDFYRRTDGETVLEVPWVYTWDSNRSFYVYQETHGGRVVVGTPQRILLRPPVAMRNAVPPEPEAFCRRGARSGARYLVVHRNVAREEDRLVPGGRVTDAEISPHLRRMLREIGTGLANRLQRQWGPPLYADRQVRVWDLQQVCPRIDKNPNQLK